MTNAIRRVYLVSLGCPKNLVDSEVILGRLEQAGYEVASQPEEADVLLINTCGFIQPAVEESIDTILELGRIKTSSIGKRLVVCGCLPQRYGKELQRELPEVDLFFGPDSLPDIVRYLAQPSEDGFCVSTASPRYIMNATEPRRISTPAHRSYLKVTDGCINRCSYCLIPQIRGSLRSRPIDDLLVEVRRLEGLGVKELTLIAQDLTAYGLDYGPDVHLKILLTRLVEGCSIPWIRLLYLHPRRVDEDLLGMIASEPRLMPYLDIPLQHVNNKILTAMNRSYDRSYIDRLMAGIRSILPAAAVRTTFMVGFPGEDEAAFAELEEFVRDFQLEHVGVFPYYNEDGCKAATFQGQLAEEVKEERRRRIMEIQQGISFENNQGCIGKVLDVLVEGESSESELLLEGRTKYQAADIDGCVYITAGVCNVGEIVRVEITEAHAYDLVGEIFPVSPS